MDHAKKIIIEMTTLNLRLTSKTKAKKYIAAHNEQIVREGLKKDKKTDLGRLVSDALDYYLKDVEV